MPYLDILKAEGRFSFHPDNTLTICELIEFDNTIETTITYETKSLPTWIAYDKHPVITCNVKPFEWNSSDTLESICQILAYNTILSDYIYQKDKDKLSELVFTGILAESSSIIIFDTIFHKEWFHGLLTNQFDDVSKDKYPETVIYDVTHLTDKVCGKWTAQPINGNDVEFKEYLIGLLVNFQQIFGSRNKNIKQIAEYTPSITELLRSQRRKSSTDIIDQ